MVNMKTNKAISLLEYTMLIAIVTAALIGAQIYLKRGVCGRWKQTADVFGFGRQYDPANTGIH